MVLTLNNLFDKIENTSHDMMYRVTMAYMEVGGACQYNNYDDAYRMSLEELYSLVTMTEIAILKLNPFIHTHRPSHYYIAAASKLNAPTNFV